MRPCVRSFPRRSFIWVLISSTRSRSFSDSVANGPTSEIPASVPSPGSLAALTSSTAACWAPMTCLFPTIILASFLTLRLPPWMSTPPAKMKTPPAETFSPALATVIPPITLRPPRSIYVLGRPLTRKIVFGLCILSTSIPAFIKSMLLDSPAVDSIESTVPLSLSPAA